MTTSSPSPDISGPCKCKLSTKASTNGDPLKAKQKKTISTVNKDATATAALTKKKTAAAAVPSVMAAKASTTKQASEKLPEKGTSGKSGLSHRSPVRYGVKNIPFCLINC